MLGMARLACHPGWGENPLRRRSDRIEIAIGQSSYANQTRHAQELERRGSEAAPLYPASAYVGTDPHPLVLAWWRGPDGTVHTGRVAPTSPIRRARWSRSGSTRRDTPPLHPTAARRSRRTPC